MTGLLKTKELSLLLFFVLVCILFFVLSVFLFVGLLFGFGYGVLYFSMNKMINLNYIFKKMTVLIFMEDKTCKTCERTMDINNFYEGLKTCKMCLSDQRTSYNKHKHRRNEVQRKRYEEDEEYRKTKQDYNKTFQSKIVSCSVCNYSMTQANYYKHQKTEKHKINLEQVSS